jgi:hypothetical protein
MLQCYMTSQDVANVLNITTDQSALLALKDSISYDPHNVLTNNWSTSTSVCNWIGITCGFCHHRITVLNLSYMGLVGTIPLYIGNLSFLVSLRVINMALCPTSLLVFTDCVTYLLNTMTLVEKSHHGWGCYPNFNFCLYLVTVSQAVFHHLYVTYLHWR